MGLLFVFSVILIIIKNCYLRKIIKSTLPKKNVKGFFTVKNVIHQNLKMTFFTVRKKKKIIMKVELERYIKKFN